MNSITSQHEFRPVLPTVFGAKDYREFRKTLEEMDHILTITGIEQRIITQKIRDTEENLSKKREQNLYRRYNQGLRYSILLGITGYSYRKLSIRQPIVIFSSGLPTQNDWETSSPCPKVLLNALKGCLVTRKLVGLFMS